MPLGARIKQYGQISTDVSFHSNRFGEIGISSLTIYSEEFFYVEKHSGASVLVSSTETNANLSSTNSAKIRFMNGAILQASKLNHYTNHMLLLLGNFKS